MNYKKSLNIITKLLQDKNFNVEEKEALATAIGVLDSAAIGKKMFESRLKVQKEKKERDVNW